MRRKGAEMCWMCDHPEATAEEYLDEVYGIMLMHGWAVQHVECERRPFAYTVGLTRRGLPELVVTGLSPRRGQRLLNIAARRALVGDLLTPGMQTTLPAGPLVETVQVTHPDAHLYCAIAIFGDKVTALQLVWADRRGRWPWAADFDEGRGSSTAKDSTSVCSCDASVRPGVKGTVMLWPAAFAAFSMAAQPPSTTRSAKDTLMFPVPSRCSGCEPPGGQPDASALNVLPDNDLVTAMQ